MSLTVSCLSLLFSVVEGVEGELRLLLEAFFLQEIDG